MTHAATPPAITLNAPWLVMDLGRTRRVLSFAPHRPGLVTARQIVMRQVRDADLGHDVDAMGWLAGQMAQQGHGDAVGMMTSRALVHYRLVHAGPVACLATVGLGNAERVGHRRSPSPTGYGTINMALLIDDGLSETAMIEALTIAAQARTAAIVDAAIPLPGGVATGTGTDCIAVACDIGANGFVGLHTELGAAIGRAAYQAVWQGARDWIAAHGQTAPQRPAPPDGSP